MLSEICICVDVVDIGTICRVVFYRGVESSGCTRSSSSEDGYEELSMAQVVEGVSMYVCDE